MSRCLALFAVACGGGAAATPPVTAHEGSTATPRAPAAITSPLVGLAHELGRRDAERLTMRLDACPGTAPFECVRVVVEVGPGGARVVGSAAVLRAGDGLERVPQDLRGLASVCGPAPPAALVRVALDGAVRQTAEGHEAPIAADEVARAIASWAGRAIPESSSESWAAPACANDPAAGSPGT